jgi:hypothetical protein
MSYWEIEMSLILTGHEEGCTPFKKCRACRAADIIFAARSTKVLAIFDEKVERPPFEPEIHIPECSPINPCRNCVDIAILRQELGSKPFSNLVELLTQSKPLHVEEEFTPPHEYNRYIAKSVYELDISNRVKNIFRVQGIHIVADICKFTEAEFKRIPKLGKESMLEIRTLLQSLGLSFGMDLSIEMISWLRSKSHDI